MHISFWEKQSYFEHSDIIIAGSGFVGLWSAFHLKKKHPKLRITIIDRGFIPMGASTRNAGFACFGSVTELVKDAAVMGEADMLSLVEMRFKGLAKIRKHFSKKEIDYDNCGGYELITSVTDDRYQELEQQIEWLNNSLAPITGKKRTFRFSDANIPRFGFAGISHIISNNLEGALHPGKLCQSLQQRVQSMGVNILPATEITLFEQHSDKVTIHTNRNVSLTADRLLVCTNGFAKHLLPELDLYPGRGQVLITAPIPSLRIKGSFHFEEGFYYFRNVGNRLLLGGARNIAIEEETTTEMEITSNIQHTLERFISDHLIPGVPFEITDRWSGIMGLGSEKMPIIKQVSEKVFCAVKMSGMGVALAPIAGERVAELLD